MMMGDGLLANSDGQPKNASSVPPRERVVQGAFCIRERSRGGLSAHVTWEAGVVAVRGVIDGKTMGKLWRLCFFFGVIF